MFSIFFSSYFLKLHYKMIFYLYTNFSYCFIYIFSYYHLLLFSQTNYLVDQYKHIMTLMYKFAYSYILPNTDSTSRDYNKNDTNNYQAKNKFTASITISCSTSVIPKYIGKRRSRSLSFVVHRSSPWNRPNRIPAGEL